MTRRPTGSPVEQLEARTLLADIASGAAITGTIDGSNLLDSFEFDGAEGGSIVASMRATTGDLEARIQLFDPSGTLVEGRGAFFDNVVTITAEGTTAGKYRVVASSNNGKTGDYMLAVASVPGEQVADGDGGPIVSGQSLTGSINGDLDAYTFAGAAGGSIVVSMQGTSDDLEARIQLFDPAGKLIEGRGAFFDNIVTITAEAPTTGTYTVVASSNNGGTGTYTLSVESFGGGGGGGNDDGDPDDQVSEARPLQLGGPANDFVATAADVDMYSFPVTAGQRLGFDIDTPTNGVPGLGSHLRVFDATGRQLAANNDAAAPGEQLGFDSYVEFTFGVSATYFVGVSNWLNIAYDAVAGDGDNVGSAHLTGAYTLVVQPVDADADDQVVEARPLQRNQASSNAISSAADVDMFKVTVATGERVGIDLDRSSGSPLDTYLRVFTFDADSNTAAELLKNNNAPGPDEAPGTDSYLEHTFESGGTYYIGVSAAGNTAYGPVSGKDGAGDTTGDYVLTVRRVGGSAPTAELTSAPDVTNSPGATYEFTVRYRDDEALDVGSFDNSEVAVRAPDGSTLPVLQTSLLVDDAGVATLTYRLDAPGGTFDPADSGTYVIELRSGVVRDLAGNSAAAGELGQFSVALVVDEPARLSLLVLDSTTGLADGRFLPAENGVPAPSLQANLSVYNRLDLWLAASATHSGGASEITAGGGVPGLLAALNLVGPGGEVAYSARFDQAGETASVAFTPASAAALTLNILDLVMPRLGFDATPENLAAVAQDIQNLPAVRSATDRLANFPLTRKAQLKAVVKTANDLRKLLSDKQQVAVLTAALAKVGYTLPARPKKFLKAALKFFEIKSLIRKIADEAVLMIQTGGAPITVSFRAENP